MGDTSIAFDLCNSDAQITPADIATVCQVRPQAVQRWLKRDARPRGRAADRLREFQAVVTAATTVIQPAAAGRWLRRPNPGLGGDSPLEVVAAGEAERVLYLLWALAEGVTS